MVSFPEELAKAVLTRRTELQISTREELSRVSGVSSRTLGDIENARKDSYAPYTLWALDSALQWEEGASMRILREGAEAATLLVHGIQAEKTDGKSESALSLPPGVLEGLSEAEQAEVRAAAVDAAFVRAREIRSSRPPLTGEAPTHANWEPHTDRLHAQAN